MPIGIDIGFRSVKVAVVEGNARTPKVVAFAERRVPFSEDPVKHYKSTVETIHALLKELKIRDENIFANLDLGRAMVRQFAMPFLKRDQIDKTIEFEAESHLHGHVLEDLILDYQVTGVVDGKSNLLVVASSKKNAKQRIQLCTDSGFNPPMLGLDVFSFLNTLQALGTLPAEKPALYVDMGAQVCKIVLLQGGKIKVLRSAHIGFFNVIRNLAAQLDCLPEDAESRFFGRDTAGLADAAAEKVTAARTDYLEKVAREVNRTLLQNGSEIPVEVMTVFGGGSLLPGADSSLADALGITVERLNLGGKFAPVGGYNAEAFNALAPIAIGTALKPLGQDFNSTDFRQKEVAYEKKFAAVQVSLLVAMSLLLILFGLLAVSQVKKLNAVTSAYVALDKKSREIWRETFPNSSGESPRLEDVQRKMNTEKSLLVEQAPILNNQKVSCLEVLAEVLRFVSQPQFKEKYQITRLTFSSVSDRGSYTLYVDVKDETVAINMSSEINKSELIRCDLPRRTVKNDIVEATYTIELKEKGGGS